MKNSIGLTLSLLLIVGCTPKPKVLYQSDAFTVYADKVVQGENVATVISRTQITSNYQSNASENYSRLITFKVSINEKDNENPPGIDHRILIGDEHESPVFRFGQVDSIQPSDPGTKLPPNYNYTFRIDMSPVLKQFKEKGYFETYDRNRISKDDFKGVYLAGNANPLSWDFVNLKGKNLELTDPDGDGIFTLTVVLNPFDVNHRENKTWNLKSDISAKPHYQSDQPIVDALFNLSLDEAHQNIEADSTFRTGAKWGGVWTRDVSYSTLLAFAYLEPEVAKISLLKKVKRGRIIQDTGSGGAWPVSSDRTTWALAAWEIYKATGDREWLKTAYSVIKNSLGDDEKTLPSVTGMYKGESSFLDWREQTYPKWMDNADIYWSENLGTNAVHYQAHVILAEMAKLLGEPYEDYLAEAKRIKEGVNQYLWMDDKGYYAQYPYGRIYQNRSPKFEALGEALSILFNVADSAKAESIIEHTPITPYGVSCIYPQIPGIPPYHNNAIWPFVQSYWNLAAAKVGNEDALNRGLASIYRAGALFLTNYENFVAQNGDYLGTEINSDRMLWSMAGNLAMVHRVFMGMSFEPDGIRFVPAIPRTYDGTKTLTNFTYRQAKLNIKVTGYGNQIATILLDGKAMENAFFPATLTGVHQIDVMMKNNRFNSHSIQGVENRFTLPNPQVKLDGNRLSWDAIAEAASYRVYKNGEVIKTLTEPQLTVNLAEFGEYKISAVDSSGTESFSSEPVLVCNPEDRVELEAEQFAKKSTLPYTNFSGSGFVELTPTKNTTVSSTVSVVQPGNYWLTCRYSNGTGPWNTDNNCAIRSLYVNEAYQGVLVFPQRGVDEWSDWGYTNGRKVQLLKGKNNITIAFKDWNINMDGEINEAMLDMVRLVKLPE